MGVVGMFCVMLVATLPHAPLPLQTNLLTHHQSPLNQKTNSQHRTQHQHLIWKYNILTNDSKVQCPVPPNGWHHRCGHTGWASGLWAGQHHIEAIAGMQKMKGSSLNWLGIRLQALCVARENRENPISHN